MEDTILQNNSQSKFKEKMWCDKELKEKIKLRYYKDVINPNLRSKLFVCFSKCREKNKYF